MPVDTKASEYIWYMAPRGNQQIVRFRWVPEGEIASSMTEGRLALEVKDVTDEWDEREMISESIPWVVAQNLARGQGFHTEMAVHA